MLRKVAAVFGVLFLLAGILGFVPAATPGGMLLGVFHVDTLHNVINLVVGVLGLAAAWGGVDFWTPELFLKVFGVLFLVYGLLGFWFGAAPIFGLVANNTAASIVHTVVGAIALYFGFGCCRHEVSKS